MTDWGTIERGAIKCKVRPGSLRPPLKRMVVHALRRQRVMSVTLDLVAQRPDHLRMAQIATFAHIDVASGEFERRIGTHALHLFDRALEIEQRRYFHDAANGDDQEDADRQ